VLLGRENGNGERIVARSVRCGNTRTESAQNRYNIDPRELVRIQLDSREEGLDILGFYHSHPDHPARWSQTDIAEAHWFGCSYVISSVEKGKAAVTNSFLLRGESEDNKRFDDEPIEVFPGD
jgi:proteasome lid subunit RPN8/RPN11